MKKRKTNAKGRNAYEPFVKLTSNLLASPAWIEASPEAHSLYIAIRKRYNGTNNGKLSFSCREAAIVIHSGKNTANNKLKELVEHGLIKQAIKGRFRNRWASTWILTNEVLDGQPATHEWKLWKPEI